MWPQIQGTLQGTKEVMVMLVALKKEQTVPTMAEDKWMDMFFTLSAHDQKLGYSI